MAAYHAAQLPITAEAAARARQQKAQAKAERVAAVHAADADSATEDGELSHSTQRRQAPHD